MTILNTMSSLSKTPHEITILIDIDDVLNNLCETWCNHLNEKYNCNVDYRQITEWDMSKFFPKLTKEQIYEPLHSPEIWKKLKPKDGAVEYVGRLAEEGFNIYLCTSTYYKNVQAKFEEVIHKYFAFIKWSQVIVASKKQMIKADFLVDDGVHNLEGGDYIKILMDAPHNQSYDAEGNGMYRAHDWREAYRLIHRLY